MNEKEIKKNEFSQVPETKQKRAFKKNDMSGKYYVPLWHKATMSIDEAASYTGIGRDKLYAMTESENCPFVLWIGNRRLIKRKRFDEYIEKAYSV